ncbi:type III-B CRISPR-associated protein Cas10/Cmr2 [Paenibacillus riograndensis]|uniref:GGDEF domain-containing protein n=1 Tax=Paenibacillus riograndensis SBR5 TaxID=1073571 RepID=A0A0E4CV64_9BACL|nr:type III-B CRISPR-associated protein Cas10/Cmr2 [Paenibacillus riograndensis]CQR53497.1 hypothetical protein PRIO_1400 [Paenibacillus riograndensis SBR5]
MEENFLQAEPQTEVVMLISIGPVQEFIAQARKTRDLWFGSHLLSEISKEAARRLAEAHNARMIFPYIHKEKIAYGLDDLKVANKVLAIVPTNDPKAVALDVRRAVVTKWLGYANKAKEELGSGIIGPMWERQVKDFIEFYAVWSELESEEKYAEVLQQTEQLMAARKTLRDFRPNEPADLFGDDKSGLDSGRESVLKPSQYMSYAGFGIKHKETLDAISLVKRLSRFTVDKKEFKSVCDVAFQQFRDELGASRNQWMKTAVDEYYRDLKHKYGTALKLTGSDLQSYKSEMFYTSRVEEAVVELAAEMKKPINRVKQLEITQNILTSLEELYGKILKEPTPYYALVVGDGDRMGDALRKMKTPAEHQSFTEHLSGFASEVERIVFKDDIKGQMIYSGGDDLMALLPVHRCLAAAQEIRQAFTNTMTLALPDEDQRPTLSVGIAIVHMFEPLEDSLLIARAAEALAKVRRDELAIHFQKRSGSEEMRVSLPFSENPVNTIVKLQSLYRNRYISTSFAYGLRQLHAEYLDLKAHGSLQNEGMGELLYFEIRRLLLLKKPEFKSKDEIIKEVLSVFKGLEQTDSDRVKDPLVLLNRLAEQCVIAVTLEKVGGAYGTNDTNSTS